MVDALIIAAGVFTIVGAVADWEWFMNGRKARPFVKAFGRDGARAFYGLLGAAICAVGALKACGILIDCGKQ